MTKTKKELWNAIVNMLPLSAYDYIDRKMNKAELQEIYNKIKPIHDSITKQIDNKIKSGNIKIN